MIQISPQEIKQRSEDKEETGKLPFRSPFERSQNCAYQVDINKIKAEEKNSIFADGNRKAECFLHEGGENERSNEKDDDDDESLKQINTAIEDLALTLEACMMKVEKILAKIREWKLQKETRPKMESPFRMVQQKQCQTLSTVWCEFLFFCIIFRTFLFVTVNYMVLFVFSMYLKDLSGWRRESLLLCLFEQSVEKLYSWFGFSLVDILLSAWV